MIFDIRPLKDEDYDTILVDWWKDWNWDAPLRDFLPDNGKGGLIVYDGETPVCAGFVYLTNSKVAWVDWIISNKNYRKKPDRGQAIGLLIETLTNLCEMNGAKFSYAHNNNIHLINTFISNGYLKGSKSTELIKKL